MAMFRPLSDLVRALAVGLLAVGLAALLARVIGLEVGDAWRYSLSFAGVLVGTLVSREYFYGEPHPFRRRTQ